MHTGMAGGGGGSGGLSGSGGSGGLDGGGIILGWVRVLSCGGNCSGFY